MPRNPLGRPNGVKENTVLKCKDAGRLRSQSQDRQLTFREKAGLRLHLWICNSCREFSRQLQLIRQACRRIEESEQIGVNAAELSSQAKTRILQELASKQSGKV
jgi:hypothetical protein